MLTRVDLRRGLLALEVADDRLPSLVRAADDEERRVGAPVLTGSHAAGVRRFRLALLDVSLDGCEDRRLRVALAEPVADLVAGRGVGAEVGERGEDGIDCGRVGRSGRRGDAAGAGARAAGRSKHQAALDRVEAGEDEVQLLVVGHRLTL